MKPLALLLAACVPTGVIDAPPRAEEPSGDDDVVSGGDASGGDVSGGDSDSPAGDPAPSGDAVVAIVAQGSVGRLTLSCDGGQTWVADQSDDADFRCDEQDCDHGLGAAMGVAFGNGWFVAAFGWGDDGHIRRSQDGVVWESLSPGTRFGGGIGGMAFGDGWFVIANDGDQTRVSQDGATWSDGGSLELEQYIAPRRLAFVPEAGGRFIAMADGPGGLPSLRLSADAGATWYAPDSQDDGCIDYPSGAASGNGVIVVSGETDHVCRSEDGGNTFEAVELPSNATSPVLFDGDEFLIWNIHTLYRSTDGDEWTSTGIADFDLNIGPAALGPGGFVATREMFYESDLAGYETQAFYRSADGLAWQSSATGDFVPSHPIRRIAFGWVTPSAECP